MEYCRAVSKICEATLNDLKGVEGRQKSSKSASQGLSNTKNEKTLDETMGQGCCYFFVPRFMTGDRHYGSRGEIHSRIHVWPKIWARVDFFWNSKRCTRNGANFFSAFLCDFGGWRRLRWVFFVISVAGSWISVGCEVFSYRFLNPAWKMPQGLRYLDPMAVASKKNWPNSLLKMCLPYII